jgi:parallel beta-helix repeat protein
MRKSLFILFLFITTLARATDYYVSNTGNNSNTGLSDAQAWATITKVNTVWNAGTFAPGDHIYFKRGGVFYGTLLVKESGAAGSPITIGAYSTGIDPVISGFTNIVTGWADMDNGIYNYYITAESTPNIMLLNGVNTPLGRWPDTGYSIIDSYTPNNNSINDTELPANPNFTGGQIVVRTSIWMLEKRTITSHLGHTLNYSNTSWTPQNGNGYFVQNDYDCLNLLGEWSWESNNLYVYFGGANPYSYAVKLSTIDHCIDITNYNYINIENITLEGGNVSNLNLSNSDNINVTNCHIQNCGMDGIYGSDNSDYLTVQNSVFYENNNTALNLNSGTHHTIYNNYIDRSGYRAGMGYTEDQSYSGIICRGNNSLITYNDILNSGYDGIDFGGNDSEVSYNSIDYFCSVKNDGGGIYTFRIVEWETGRTIKYNIITNGQPGNESYWDKVNYQTQGIYIDGARNLTITYNVLAHNPDAGINLNGSQNCTVRYNTCFDNGCAIHYVMVYSDYPLRTQTVDHNILFGLTATDPYLHVQACIKCSTTSNGSDIVNLGTADYNYLARPISNDNYVDIYKNYSCWEDSPSCRWSYNLSEWRTESGQDAHSTFGSYSVTTINDIHFIYNDTTYARNWVLSTTMHDGTNTAYSGTVTLQPYTSLVLIGIGTVYETGGSLPVYVPTVITSSITNYGTTVLSGGDITSNGGAPVTARGICYSLGTNPTIGDSHTSDGTGSGNFTSILTGLTSGLTYYIRAYGTNSAGTGYGSERNFLTYTSLTYPSILLKYNGRFIKYNGRLMKMQ